MIIILVAWGLRTAFARHLPEPRLPHVLLHSTVPDQLLLPHFNHQTWRRGRKPRGSRQLGLVVTVGVSLVVEVHLPRLGWLDCNALVPLETSLAWKLLPALHFPHVLLPSPSLAPAPYACGLNRHLQQEAAQERSARNFCAATGWSCMCFPSFVNLFPDGRKSLLSIVITSFSPFFVPIKSEFGVLWLCSHRHGLIEAIHVCFRFPQGAVINIRIALPTHCMYRTLPGTYYETLRIPCFIALFKLKCNEMRLWINRSNGKINNKNKNNNKV